MGLARDQLSGGVGTRTCVARVGGRLWWESWWFQSNFAGILQKVMRRLILAKRAESRGRCLRDACALRPHLLDMLLSCIDAMMKCTRERHMYPQVTMRRMNRRWLCSPV